MINIYCKGLGQLSEVSRKVIAFCEKEKVWAFKGEMGVGKTSLIKAIGEVFGIEAQITSPSYSIINEYINPKGEKYYHFDFYRINDMSEILELGLEEYFYSGNYCWIEWPEKIQGFVPSDFMLIQMDLDEKEGRSITINRYINGSKDN